MEKRLQNFHILGGLKEGDAISPLLFNFSYAIKKVKKTTRD
jgi:hypothetical protein